MKEPNFWYDKTIQPPLFKKLLLGFLSRLFLFGAFLKKLIISKKSVSKPVICIGNLNIGGAGKTPTTLSIAKFFKGKDKKVAIISRGYKGNLKGPLQVNPKIHSALDVGDEPLLMAQYYPTWISANRYKGAKAAIEDGADIILLDDGLQHHTLKQDLKICIINPRLGFGNEKVIPAGPLRETLPKGLERVDAFITVSNMPSKRFLIETKKPVLRAEVTIDPEHWRTLKDKNLIAFAGLAHPEKFFRTLQREDFNIKKVIPFPDHYAYTKQDLDNLLETAKKHKGHLVTTEKDWVRLPKNYQKKILHLPIKLEYQNPHSLRYLLAPFLEKDKKND